MEKIIAGSLNIDASDDWMKFMPNCFKCLRASGDDLSVVELVKIVSKGVDKVNETNTIAKSRAEQSRGLATFMVKKVAAMQGKFMTLMRFVLRSQTCKVEGGNRTSWKLKE